MRSFACFMIMLSVLKVGAVDGKWCSDDGRTISVNGLTVVAANGLPAVGAYTEKAFYFAEPRADGRAGPEIWMEPKGPDAVRVSVVSEVQKEPPPHDLWSRCGVTS